ncbi:putative LRR receptor-like serine/threonine-protein kinase [Gossypium australe]|uniref:Putative LRR receptor-like serine/threonine-protein kinase n=1 Tax=Gossypium australe TaxID=47621 RepID=A0A5B6X1A2_9ROSI|nr:putative LRR receptor-like serine/threonine-protein kinase [Gossypium australe]
MQTRPKCGIFKPKIYAVKLVDCEPLSIDEAVLSKKWMNDAQQEYQALMKNQTWELVLLPPNRRLVGWIDFNETFNPVVKPTTIWVVLSLAVTFGWKLRQVDINNAFYNGDLVEEIYITQPLGFEQQSKVGFTLAKSDDSLFIKYYVLVYVDDIIVTGNHQPSIDEFLDSLDSRFSLKDLGQSRMESSKGTPTPMVFFCVLSAHAGSPIENKSKHRSIVNWEIKLQADIF